MAHANIIEFSPAKHVGRTLLVGAFLTALSVGAERAATYTDTRRLKKKSRLISHLRDEGRPIYIMPGCRADGEYIGEMLEPLIHHIGPTARAV